MCRRQDGRNREPRRVGTVQYAAPELYRGWLSDRTDQYALAVSYYQLRTGMFPFPDTPPTFETDYVRPAPELTSVTPAEQSILARALDPTPQGRWPTCVEMMRRLTETLAPKNHGLAVAGAG